jgi:periplasmic protein TonB
MTSATPQIPDLLITGRPNVSAHDRIGFSLFVAFILHATLIFGISFSAQVRSPSPLSLEVTLAQFQDEEAPENADFIAQTNQQGSGTEIDKTELTTREKPEFRDLQSREVVESEVGQAQQKIVTAKQTAISTSADTESVMPATKPPEQSTTRGQHKKRSLMRNALEIASLEAKLDHQRKSYARRPRVTRLTAVSAKASATAFYMQNWVRKVERVGNLNYPEEARRRGLAGKVRVAVLINDKGGVEGVEILESSGVKVLDDAVIRIVRLAAPFGAFTDSMREEADQFEIIRTFDFGKRISSF